MIRHSLVKRAVLVAIAHVVALCSCVTTLSAQSTPNKPQAHREVDSLITAAHESIYIGELDQAARLGEQAHALAEDADYGIGRGKYEGFLGSLAEAKGNIPAAMGHYFAAIEIYKQIDHKMGLGVIYVDLGNTALSVRQLDKAAWYFTQSLQIFEALNDTSGIAVCCGNLGIVSRDKGRYDEYLEASLRAAGLHAALRDSLRLGQSYEHAASAYYLREQFADAIEYRMRAVRCFLRIGRQDLANGEYTQIGETYRRLGKYDSARVYLDRALTAHLRSGNKGALLNVYDFLAKLDSTTGRYKEALFNKAMYMHYRDSVNMITSQDKFTVSEKQYEYRQKEYRAQQELEREQLLRNVMLGGVAAMVVFVLVVYRQRNRITREKARSEALLLNILPAETAEELKVTGASVARQYENVTVLFTDFVNFTGISETLTPTELVAEIHRYFTAFDAIIERNGLEKIKTIGDAYLAVCGLPHATPDHALRTVRAALEITQYVAENGETFRVRVGVHSGPVVAGIVGVKKFAYDIWGDTVNTASRMESAGEEGKVNISEATYHLVKDDVSCEYRGVIDVKGKGAVPMYFVVGA